jgi:von Willebrand factor type A domain
MTRLRLFSRTSWLWLDGAAVFTAAAFLACGGPVPIAGSSSLTGGARGGKGTNTNFGLDTNPSTSINTSVDTGTEVSSADGGNCGITTAPLNKQPPDVLLVLDKTGSLLDAMDSTSQCAAGSTTCQQRWATLVSGLNAVLTSSSTNVNWGLETFNSDGSCGVDPPEVPITPGAAGATAVQTYIAGITPNGSTPTKLAISTAVTYLQTLTDPNPKYILLATDGEPNCLGGKGGGGGGGATDLTGAEGAAAAALNAGYKVYVLGVGPETTNLTGLANAGGTTDYYPALTPDALTTALASIMGSVVSCSFGLGKAPPVPTNVAVQFNNDSTLRAPHDTSHANGWDYTTPANTTIQLYGSWCDDVTSGKYTSAQILMGCPGGAIIQK